MPKAKAPRDDAGSDNEEFEDHFVYVDFSGALQSGEIPGKHKGTEGGWSATDVVSIDHSSLLTNTLTCRINGATFTGQHAINLGTQVFFSVSGAAAAGAAAGTAAGSSARKRAKIEDEDVRGKLTAETAGQSAGTVQLLGMSLQKVAMRKSS